MHLVLLYYWSVGEVVISKWNYNMDQSFSNVLLLSNLIIRFTHFKCKEVWNLIFELLLHFNVIATTKMSYTSWIVSNVLVLIIYYFLTNINEFCF